MANKAVLMLNLGSPESTSVPDVKRYLGEFLSDERVIDKAFVRKVIVPAIILQTRPKKSAEAYESIWTEEGSPLIVTSIKQQKLLQDELDIPVEIAMRYGNPSVASAIDKLVREGVEELYVMPLYPHYAMSSYETVVVKVMEEIAQRAPRMKTTTLQPFYNDPQYIEALVESSAPYLAQDYDLLLFSFHGIPERHLRVTDPSHAHCLTVPDCCETCSPSHATCYRHQCFETVRLFVEKAGIPKERYSVSFQSRLGSDPWLKPYTDFELERFAKEGVKKMLVICPAFITDCLETLEEIAVEGKEQFINAGGESLIQIPCLNDHPKWIQMLADRVATWQNV